MNVIDIAAELRRIAKSEKNLEEGVGAASRLLAEPRYAAGGAGRLANDIRIAISRLPQTAQEHAEALLTPDDGYIKWGIRIMIVPGNGGGRARYAELIFAYIAHELLALWHQDDLSNPVPTHAFEQYEYSCSLDYDAADYRKQTEIRTAKMRTVLPDQRVVGMRYYTHRFPPTPIRNGVTPLDNKHTYLATLPDPMPGSTADWWMHFVHLGGRVEPNQPVTVALEERYFDRETRDRQPHLTYEARFETVEAALAIHLPAKFVGRVSAEAREVANAHAEPNILTRQPIPITPDGWVRWKFPECRRGIQYGIFFDDFDLYK